MNKRIGVMGCGWLGLPLAEHFKNAGFSVKGTTTSTEKADKISKKGIEPYIIELKESKITGDISGFLEELEILVINIPPKLRTPPFENYVSKMEGLIEAIDKSSVEKVVFVSSTSVYGNSDEEITEATPPDPSTESGKQLVASEKLFQNHNRLKTTVLRLGGLIGVDRHPVFHLSGKKGLENGDDFVNLIHRKDVIRIIEKIVLGDLWNCIINGVYPHHPTKREYYTSEAKKRKLPIPNYAKKSSINSKKLVKCSIFPTFYQHPVTTSL